MFPAIGFAQRVLDGMVNLVLRPIVSFQTVRPYPVLAFTEIKSVLLLQFLADLDIPITVVSVTYGASVVIHPVENDVDVRMLLVVMPGNDILGISDSHFLHILLCQTYQRFIRHSRSVLRCIAERDMSHRLTDIWLHHPLGLKTVRNALDAVLQHSFRNQQSCIGLAQYIINTALESRSLTYFSNHRTTVL